MKARPRVWISRDWSPGNHNLAIVEDTEPGKIRVATGFTWAPHEEGDKFEANEGIVRADDLIQEILDKAWEAGFRPTGFSDVKAETTALKGHLDDMRSIAFHQLKMDKQRKLG